MGLNFRQFELGVLRPALAGEPEVAVRLVGETIWHESDRLQALGQYPRDPVDVFGPGLGICSMERSTWNWLKDKDRIRGTLALRQYEELAWDLRLNVIACRLRYLVNPLSLPKLEDGVEARSVYWFRIYNASGVIERRIKYIDDARAIPWVR